MLEHMETCVGKICKPRSYAVHVMIAVTGTRYCYTHAAHQNCAIQRCDTYQMKQHSFET